MTRRGSVVRRLLLAVLAVLAGTAAFALAAAGPPAPPAAPGEQPGDLRRLFDGRNFFALRDRLGEESPSASSEEHFYRAALALAFNRPQEAWSRLRQLGGDPVLPNELRPRQARLVLATAVRLHRYADALGAAEAIVATGPGAYLPAHRSEAANLARLARALADVAPQRAEIGGPSRLALHNDGRVPLRIGDRKTRLALDTGANLSVLSRSEARAAGLAIRPAGIEVATSNGGRVTADVAVADRVELGNVVLRHVVFLIFPDEALTFADGGTLPGLVGFPVIEALGEVRFRRDNVLEIPVDPPRRTLANLALDDLEPLVRVRYGKDDLLCRLDTGAAETVFFEPFYRRYRERIEKAGRPVSIEVTGIGGAREIAAYRLGRTALTVAAAGVNLRHAHVYTRPIVPANENYLDCNLGVDAFRRWRWFAINFRDMALAVG